MMAPTAPLVDRQLYILRKHTEFSRRFLISILKARVDAHRRIVPVQYSGFESSNVRQDLSWQEPGNGRVRPSLSGRRPQDLRQISLGSIVAIRAFIEADLFTVLVVIDHVRKTRE